MKDGCIKNDMKRNPSFSFSGAAEPADYFQRFGFYFRLPTSAVFCFSVMMVNHGGEAPRRAKMIVMNLAKHLSGSIHENNLPLTTGRLFCF